jgi:hypothetical protein
MDLHLTVTAEEAETLGRALLTRPMGEVMGLFQKLQMQIAQQQRTLQDLVKTDTDPGGP